MAVSSTSFGEVASLAVTSPFTDSSAIISFLHAVRIREADRKRKPRFFRFMDTHFFRCFRNWNDPHLTKMVPENIVEQNKQLGEMLKKSKRDGYERIMVGSKLPEWFTYTIYSHIFTQ